MKILYISVLSSERLIDDIYQRSKQNPGFAVQKFSRLLVKGLLDNHAEVMALSNPPSLAYNQRYWVSLGSEEESGICYKYIPYINLPFLKHCCLFLYSFCYVLAWGLIDRKNKAIVCDVLAISICMGAWLASKINRVISVGVVTDIYGLMVGNGKLSFLSRMAAFLNEWYVTSFSKYILLTEQMNSLVNPKGHPYMVMEALCDSSLADQPFDPVEKVHPRTVIYAGGIHEKYGLKMLAEGFIKADVTDAKLVYFGSGGYVDEYKRLCELHSNLEYRGVATNEVVVAEELKATLLVNPRFTTEAFTKYSFPSKNMEYMASGTPLLTTKLPGMPQEYYPHVFLFEEETVEGYAEVLRTILTYTEDELMVKGLDARDFVLKTKNNIEQGKRVLAFISSDYPSDRNLKTI